MAQNTVHCYAALTALGLRTCQLVRWHPARWAAARAAAVRADIAQTGVHVTAFWAGWSGPAVGDLVDGPATLGLVPPYTFLATASALLRVNAMPVIADIEPRTLCIDLRDVARRISPRTRAIINLCNNYLTKRTRGDRVDALSQTRVQQFWHSFCPLYPLC